MALDRQVLYASKAILFRSGGLGDVLLTFPLLNVLQKIFNEVIVCIPSKYHFLVREFTPNTQLHNLDDGAEKILKYVVGAEVICFWNDPEWIKEWKLAGAKKVMVFDSRPIEGVHFSKSLTDHFNQPISRQELNKAWLVQDKVSVNAHTQNLWVHPGSGGTEKNLPLSEFIYFAQKWLDKKQSSQVFFSFGEADLELENEFTQHDFSRNYRVRSKVFLSLKDFFLTLRGYQGSFAGNDSGPSHMAAMLGKKTHVWFRTTNPAVWSPLGPYVKVYQADSVPSKIL